MLIRLCQDCFLGLGSIFLFIESSTSALGKSFQFPNFGLAKLRSKSVGFDSLGICIYWTNLRYVVSCILFGFGNTLLKNLE
ncbi:hypothetical protein CUMW_285770 [Citrus unshiu]|uniref:Uncharacterized protein n=1 Tax=Citrus unshiu TaxID=55188 RepID=A0A2H5N0G9_CITUN|nr:hypothetical protein CUMW_285770 [Citrus unshiu]